ncbi:hypothetical protein J2X11_002333 [Aeromicrobium panaciterrae]|uniref:Uncharacterized protein n=1 Tax=Aeromicrobium panaciterrae TaxID=363861 RepID=A0ABU1UQN4_9ACTN|nr:hypothetical protein [Aeromicrobium panaciterrae]MDR7087494.1 hypothetical protein [Aeromicrobium panaciterrae]
MAMRYPNPYRDTYLTVAAILIVGGVIAILARDNGWSGSGFVTTFWSIIAIVLGLLCLKKGVRG